MITQLCTLAFRQFADGACSSIGASAGEHAIVGVVGHLSRHFTDHSLLLTKAMQSANDQAWRAMEVALAGESLWTWLDKADNKAFREQVRAFLEATPLDGMPSHLPKFRERCLQELKTARKQGVLSGSMEPETLAKNVGEFARFSDPDSLMNAEWQAIEAMGKDLEDKNFYHLAHLVKLQVSPAEKQALLVVAVRYFLRREIESNQELFQGLSWAKLEVLQAGQTQAFQGLADVFTDHMSNIESVLDSLQGVVVETHGVVLDIQSEVSQLAQRFDVLQRELRPRDSLSLQNESERQMVKQLVERYRTLPDEDRKQFPDLLNALGKLEVATGAFASAQEKFQEAAQLSQDDREKAEAHYNLFNAALERSDWEAAMQAVQDAANLDREKYAPFPLNKYEPERILGAGGFGVAFLCRNKLSDVRLVVKTLRSDTLERDVKEVFREAQILEQLDHPAIIRSRDCDFADDGMTRPYLVMDFFEGETLESYIKKNGTLSVEEVVGLMIPVAEALQAAHEKNILHRDIKPGNLLVRKNSDGTWKVKVIDFGLALKQQVMHDRSVSAAVHQQTTLGYSIAGTMDYGAPEQMGKLPGVAVGPYTDVFGFARTCCYALFNTVNPLRKHWRDIPEDLADVLEPCLSEDPKERLQTFAEVLQAMQPLTGQSAQPEPVTFVPPDSSQSQSMTSQDTEDAMIDVQGTAGQTGGRADWWKTAVESPSGEAEVLHTLTGHTDSVLSVAFSYDGEKLLSGGADGSVRLWDAFTGKPLHLLHGHLDRVWSVAFLPGDKHAISAGKDKTVHVWNLETGQSIKEYPNRTNRSVAVSPDGQLAMTGNITDGMVRLWDLQTGRSVRQFKGHMSWILGLAFSQNGRNALSSSADGTIRLWDVNSGRELRRLTGHTDQVWSVAFAPGANLALSSSADKTVRLWDLRSGKQVGCYDHYLEQVWSVAISPKGRLALSDADSWTARLWQLGQEKEYPPMKGHNGKILSVAFSEVGLAATASTDKTIKLWKLPK